MDLIAIEPFLEEFDKCSKSKQTSNKKCLKKSQLYRTANRSMYAISEIAIGIFHSNVYCCRHIVQSTWNPRNHLKINVPIEFIATLIITRKCQSAINCNQTYKLANFSWNEYLHHELNDVTLFQWLTRIAMTTMLIKSDKQNHCHRFHS